MKSSRSANPVTRPVSRLVHSETLAASWTRFWFLSVDPIGLHVVRVLAGLLFLSWLLPFAGDLDSLLGLEGWFDRKGYKELASSPDASFWPVGWSALYLFGTDPQTLAAVYWTSVAIVALFTLGVAPRVTAILTWLIVVSLSWNPATFFEGDVLIRILAFYLMLGYVFLGQGTLEASLPHRVLGSTWFLRRWWSKDAERPQPSLAAGLALRLLQVHFAIVIVASGLHKLQFGDWWAGTALWFSLYPPYETTLEVAQTHVAQKEMYLGLISLATYATLIWQIGFPLFAWRPRWRLVLVGGALIGWLWTALNYKLPVVGPALVIGCLSFITAEEWYWLLSLAARFPGLQFLNRLLPEESQEEPLPGIRRDVAAPVPARSEVRITKAEAVTSRNSGD